MQEQMLCCLLVAWRSAALASLLTAEKLSISFSQDEFNFSIIPLQTQCLKRPCSINAKCIPDYATGGYECECFPGYTGNQCETGKRNVLTTCKQWAYSQILFTLECACAYKSLDRRRFNLFETDIIQSSNSMDWINNQSAPTYDVVLAFLIEG